MMRRMGQIARETSMRTFVTLTASLDDIVAAQSRSGVCRTQYVVRAMAVVALRYRLCAQSRNLAMESVEESLRLINVTSSALFHHLRPKSRLLRA